MPRVSDFTPAVDPIDTRPGYSFDPPRSFHTPLTRGLPDVGGRDLPYPAAMPLVDIGGCDVNHRYGYGGYCYNSGGAGAFVGLGCCRGSRRGDRCRNQDHDAATGVFGRQRQWVRLPAMRGV